MKIVDLKIQSFRTHADRFQHGVAHPGQELTQTITSIETDDGVIGYYLGGGSHGDQEGLSADDQRLLLGRMRTLLIGQDPLDRAAPGCGPATRGGISDSGSSDARAGARQCGRHAPSDPRGTVVRTQGRRIGTRRRAHAERQRGDAAGPWQVGYSTSGNHDA